MRKIRMIVSSALLVSSAAFAFEGQRTFMPPNKLHLEAQDGAGISEAQFNAVIDRAEAIYKPLFTKFGATLSIDRRWSDETVNASADQAGNTWRVNMYGGLARRGEVTEDGFAMVLCHEIGHHIGGYPYVQDWAANEGQSDIHATGACAAKMFAVNEELSFAAQENLPEEMKAKCDAHHADATGRDICYRSMVAGKSLADLLAALGNTKANFETPDTTVVSKTNNSHPAAQCRLDTYVAGALCGASKWDYNLIPGKSFPKRNSMDAQKEAYDHSCETGEGARPKCWFAALTTDPAPGGDCPLGDEALCTLICQIDPSQPWCLAKN
jgi:hypothetical protein